MKNYTNGTLLSYVYNRRQKVKGMIVAQPDESDSNKIRIGYSVCDLQHDEFDKEQGLIKAIGRSKQWMNMERLHTGRDMNAPLHKFIARCKRYYKESTFPVWASDPDRIFIKS